MAASAPGYVWVHVPAAPVPPVSGRPASTSSDRCSGARGPDRRTASWSAPLVVVAPSTLHDPAQRMLRAALEGLLQRARSCAGDHGPSRRARADQGRTQCAARELDVIPGGDARCALVICHGGHGTVARALAARRAGAGGAAQRRYGRERGPNRLGGGRRAVAVAAAVGQDPAACRRAGSRGARGSGRARPRTRSVGCVNDVDAPRS